MGRPPLRAGHVDSLEGSSVEKERLRVILESLAGELTIEEACARLDLARSRFFELRGIALQSALDGLAPGLPGRPRKQRASNGRELELVRRVEALEEELAAERVRSEMALVMPRLLDRDGRGRPRGEAVLALGRAIRRVSGTTRG